MRVVVQRVSAAQVVVDGAAVGSIDHGMLVLVGFTDGDDAAQLRWMADKLGGLRIFEDDQGKMNLSVTEIGGSVLLVPNFTLYADCQKGRRPSFSRAAEPSIATELFNGFCDLLQESGLQIAKGVFGAYMQVSLCNDGPVTFIIDSPK
ncbi:MAG: D-tyrosyl-tRNA(Tyr) deacylase [candidate division WS1 bacterium]|jgi:D-tyrosyl-tRNA(Tyr) deacylase|nr:D-tyrosyl-tRNA(Tyr) deacylase [candidate division WS1 bacterium]